MPSRCQEGLSLERLEVLGDAVLKLLVGLHLYQQHPTAHEGAFPTLLSFHRGCCPIVIHTAAFQRAVSGGCQHMLCPETLPWNM